GHVVLRADLPAGYSRRLSRARRRAASGRHRGDRRLGARALSEGRLGTRPVRRDGALRALRPAPRRATRLGHLRVRLWPTRGAQLPGGQRAVLASGIPHRRPAGGRGGIDALSRLLAAGRRLDAEHLWWAGKPRGRAVPAGDERDGAQDHPRYRHGRGRVDVMACRNPADKPWWPWLFDEVEHGLDERHARLHRPGPDSPQLSPPRDDVLAAVRV